MSNGRSFSSRLQVLRSPLPMPRYQKDGSRWNLVRWLKFNFVGGIGILVQLATLTFLRSVLRFDYLLATGLAVETAVIHNFLWHERFTWRDRPAAHTLQSLVRFAKFNLSNGAVSLVGNLLIMSFLVGKLHMYYVIANLIAVAACSLMNFLLGEWFVFDRPRSLEPGKIHLQPENPLAEPGVLLPRGPHRAVPPSGYVAPAALASGNPLGRAAQRQLRSSRA